MTGDLVVVVVDGIGTGLGGELMRRLIDRRVWMNLPLNYSIRRLLRISQKCLTERNFFLDF